MSHRRVEVAVRVRAADHPRDASCVSLDADTHRIHVVDESGLSGGSGQRSYKEDLLFAADVSNRAIFNELVLKKMTSATAEHPDTLCFLAYGHTSSGKTYTIAGSDEEPGILTLCVEELLRREGVVEVAMLEVYMDTVYDLLAEGQARPIRRRQGQQGALIVVEGLTTCALASVEQWRAVSAYGMRSRRTAPTERNARSSRSHAIFTIKSRGVRLCLVDLAGSERQTVFSPQLNRESISINKSLSRLSTVLEALSNQRVSEDGRRSYVNFRDTTLTVLLQRYLTGASLTTFLACIHPGVRNIQETLSTLRYTQRLKRIHTRVTKPHMEGDWSGIKPVEHQELLEELMRLRAHVKASESTSKRIEEAQQQRIAALEHTLASQQQQQQSQALAQTDTQKASRSTAVAPLSANVRVRDTRRVAGWLLSRVLGELPEINVGYDDYFDSFFPPSVQVIGYVSTMAGLVPRAERDEPLAFLDVGDLAMGLSMLDAGIPPFVRLHVAGCPDPTGWEAQECGEAAGEVQSVVYVLAFFEFHAKAMAPAADETDGEALACCRGYITSAPLLPIATVLCVPTSAPRAAKERLLQRLIDLQCEQQEVVEERIGRATSRTSSLNSPFSETRGAIPPAADLLDASLLAEEEARGEAERYNGLPEVSLLAQELRRQAADTSHIVTPYKESSSTASCSSHSSSSNGMAPPAGRARASGTAPNVRRDLLVEFGPSQQPRTGAAQEHEEVEAAVDAGDIAVHVSPPAAAAASSGAVPPRTRPASHPPPPSPPAAGPPLPPVHPEKRRRAAGEGPDKTARSHGCHGCTVV